MSPSSPDNYRKKTCPTTTVPTQPRLFLHLAHEPLPWEPGLNPHTVSARPRPESRPQLLSSPLITWYPSLAQPPITTLQPHPRNIPSPGLDPKTLNPSSADAHGNRVASSCPLDTLDHKTLSRSTCNNGRRGFDFCGPMGPALPRSLTHSQQRPRDSYTSQTTACV